MSDEYRVIYKTKESKARERVDHYLVKVLPKNKVSRTYLKKLINSGDVLLNGKAVKPHHLLNPGDIIAVKLTAPPSEKGPLPEKIALDILYEDEDIIVVNKPAGMVVHPGAGVYDGTLVNALMYYSKVLSSAGGKFRPGIVHRIDKGTSGLLIVAKNDAAHRELAGQFKERKVKRTYLALVNGIVELDNGKVELPIGRHPRNPKKMAVAFSKSKAAFTNFRVLRRLKDYTLLEINPDTGRTHQIRVHMAYLDHALLGDVQYGKPDSRIERQALHAGKIKFSHPGTGKPMEFEVPVPEDMRKLID